MSRHGSTRGPMWESPSHSQPSSGASSGYADQHARRSSIGSTAHHSHLPLTGGRTGSHADHVERLVSQLWQGGSPSGHRQSGVSATSFSGLPMAEPAPGQYMAGQGYGSAATSRTASFMAPLPSRMGSKAFAGMEISGTDFGAYLDPSTRMADDSLLGTVVQRSHDARPADTDVREVASSATTSASSAVKEYEDMLRHRLSLPGTPRGPPQESSHHAKSRHSSAPSDDMSPHRRQGGSGLGEAAAAAAAADTPPRAGQHRGARERSSASSRRRSGGEEEGAAPVKSPQKRRPPAIDVSPHGARGGSGGGGGVAEFAGGGGGGGVGGGGGGGLGMDPGGPDLYLRTDQWKKGKENQLLLKRERRLADEAALCSFQPKINASHKGGSGRQHEADVVTRLYTSHKQTHVTLEAERRRRMEAEEEACTFRPEVNRSPWVEEVEPRYLNPKGKRKPRGRGGGGGGAAAASGRSSDGSQTEEAYTMTGVQVAASESDGEETDDREPTFRPKINTHFQPQGLGSYLSTNAFERLSSVYSQKDAVKHSQRYHVFGEDGQDERFVVRGVGEYDKENCAPEKRLDQRELDQFLQRVKDHEEKRLERMEALKCKDPVEQRGFKPRLNQRSKDMMQARNGEHPFQDRMGKDAEKRVLREQRFAETRATREEVCSFRPAITLSARSLRARSVDEMSSGDHKRKEERIKRKARERFDKEQAHCTFRPQLNDTINAKSKVSVRTDPMGYVQWAKSRQDKRTHYLEREKEKKEEEDRRTCTFKPQIHSAPGYVSTIAASVTLAKPVQKDEAAPHHTFGYS